MNVLFLMIIPVDIKNNANLYTDLMEEFRERGHNVYAVDIRERKTGLSTEKSHDSGITVLHVKTGNMFGVNPIEKGLTTVSLAGRFKKAIRRYYNHIKFDLVLMPTPPITIAPVMADIMKRDGAKSYLILRDIFPQNAKDIALMKNEILFRWFRRQEQKMYAIAQHIGCMSQGNIQYVQTHNPQIDMSKLELLPNWMKIAPKPSSDFSAEARVDLKKKYGIERELVCVFGGNIGWPQELRFLLKLAALCQERRDVLFLIIGKGILKASLASQVEEEKLDNVKFLEAVPREDYDALIRQCDIGLINLDRRFTIPNIPSKTLGYFAAELPILASTDANTDYPRILKEAGAGLWSETGDLKAYKQNLDMLLDNDQLRKQMGRRGRQYLEDNLTVEKAYDTIIQHVQKA